MSLDQKPQLEIGAIGVGGNGASIVDSCITDPRFKDAILHVAIGNDDDGGDTGEKKRFAEATLSDPEDSYGMQRLFPHFASLPQAVLPVGDLRSNMYRWLKLMYSEDPRLEGIMDFFNPNNRVTDPSAIAPQIDQFLELMQVDRSTLPRLDQFLEQYSNFFATQQHRHSVANTLLTYLFLECGQQDLFFAKLREMQLLPANFRLYYLSDYRLELCAVDILGEHINGESNIDNHHHIIVPSSYYLRNPDGSLFRPGDVNPKLKLALERCDAVVAVTGSIANLIPLFKLLFIDNNLSGHYQVEHQSVTTDGAESLAYEPQAINIGVPPIWVGNSFAGQNEPPLHTLVDYLARRVPNLIALLPEGSPILNANLVDGGNNLVSRLMFAQDAYERQGKTAANDTLIDSVIDNLPPEKQQMMLRVLSTELHEIGKLGVKYDTYEVMSWIWLIYKITNYTAEHAAEAEVVDRYRIIGKFLQEFASSSATDDPELQRQFRLQAMNEVETWIDTIQETIRQQLR
jgi:hypothetical protein